MTSTEMVTEKHASGREQDSHLVEELAAIAEIVLILGGESVDLGL
jgi:hypothetical protein